MTEVDGKDFILLRLLCSNFLDLLITDEVIQMVFEATDLDNDDKMSKTEFKNLIQVSNSLSVCFANAITGFNEKLDL